MDKDHHKICDRCDHNMSNTMFKEELKGNIKAKIETLAEDKTRIKRHEEKLASIR